MIKVSFETQRCKGCGLCVSVCPVRILAIDKDTLNQKGYHPSMIVDQSKCIACKNCATLCPDQVIRIEKYEEES